jgi:hypothetical protein
MERSKEFMITAKKKSSLTMELKEKFFLMVTRLCILTIMT